MLIILGLVFTVLPSTQAQRDELPCEEVFDFMYAQWAKVKTMRYHSVKYERTPDGVDEAAFDFVVQRKPFKVAGRMMEKGHYILYDPAVSATQATYISNGFPYTNLMLDVHGKVFRGTNHYTISDAGCEFIFGIMKGQFKKIPQHFSCALITRKGREEYAIEAQTDEWKLVPYKAQPGENVLDIADKLGVSAYLIIERNDAVDEYLDDCTGLTLMVPTHYGVKVRLHIDAKLGLPTLIENYDDRGLFERYEYTNYQVNFSLPSDYFTTDYLDELD
jgi:outer membrane lipoprotein-sorting protein